MPWLLHWACPPKKELFSIFGKHSKQRYQSGLRLRLAFQSTFQSTSYVSTFQTRSQHDTMKLLRQKLLIEHLGIFKMPCLSISLANFSVSCNLLCSILSHKGRSAFRGNSRFAAFTMASTPVSLKRLWLKCTSSIAWQCLKISPNSLAPSSPYCEYLWVVVVFSNRVIQVMVMILICDGNKIWDF